MTGKQEGPYKGEETKVEEDKVWHITIIVMFLKSHLCSDEEAWVSVKLKWVKQMSLFLWIPWDILTLQENKLLLECLFEKPPTCILKSAGW